MRKALERIARKDPAAIFANPVTVKDVSEGGEEEGDENGGR